MIKDEEFEKNVFINCPFDLEYKQMLYALIFTAARCGLEPRIATESEDSGKVRIDKIKELIKCSKYSIHDISRMEPLKKSDLPRFNLPFELGLDLGCRTYGIGKLKTKKFLILEKERNRYFQVISDIAGYDISAHSSIKRILVRKVRDWIQNTLKKQTPGSRKVWDDYLVCYIDFLDHFKKKGFDDDDIKHMNIAEYIGYVRKWITDQITSKKRTVEKST